MILYSVWLITKDGKVGGKKIKLIYFLTRVRVAQNSYGHLIAEEMKESNR